MKMHTSKLPFANGLEEFKLLSVQGPAACKDRTDDSQQSSQSRNKILWLKSVSVKACLRKKGKTNIY